MESDGHNYLKDIIYDDGIVRGNYTHDDYGYGLRPTMRMLNF